MLEPMVRALMFGEKKYSRHNYKTGFKNTRLTAAALRHIMAYQDGEDNDPESGISHLAHAMVALGMLLDNKANVNAKTSIGQTPLYYAVKEGNKNVVELLRQHGGHE